MDIPQDPPGAVERQSGRGSRLGAVLGASAAAVASAGLVLWVSSSDDRSLSLSHPPEPAARPAAHAAMQAQPDQVRRAYEQMEEVYGDRGFAGVMAFTKACANELKSNPEMLDFCLAFDIYASSLQGDDTADRAWQADGLMRDLALAQAALPPGTDAGARVERVRQLTRYPGAAAPEVVATLPPPPAAAAAPETRAAAPPRAAAAARPVGANAVKPVRTKSARVVARPSGARAHCVARGTAAQRLVCASPKLRAADRRMRTAYGQALKAGVDPRRLARDQARWRRQVNAAASNRAAVARLYQRRTHSLEVLARRYP